MKENSMTAHQEKYRIGDTCLHDIRNRNETRVVKALNQWLEEPDAPALNARQIQDVYALALNLLPSRYAQRGTIVVHEPVRMHDIAKAIRTACETVLNNPKP